MQVDTERMINVPLKGSDDVVELDLNTIPSADEVLPMLEGEQVPLMIWVILSSEYYRQSKIDDFIKIVEAGTTPTWQARDKIGVIFLLNLKASYCLDLINTKYVNDDTMTQEMYQQATELFNKADQIDIRQPITWLGKGLFRLIEGDLKRATTQFNSVLSLDPDNIPALLGKAQILGRSEQWSGALEIYRQILKNSAQMGVLCPNEVRNGIALCCYHLEDYDTAYAAYKRVVDLDPNNAVALVGLSILNNLKMDSVNDPNQHVQIMNESLSLLKRAYQSKSLSPMVFNRLANHFFHKKSFAKVGPLATKAYNATRDNKVKAEACFNLGRLFHANGDLEKAFQYYEKAVSLWPEYMLAQYGLGKLLIYKNELDDALKCFETILKDSKHNFDVLKIVGSLYKRMSRNNEAYEVLSNAVKHNPDEDREMWIELAELQEKVNPKESLVSYQRALSMFESSGDPIPVQLFVNIGALSHFVGQFDQALEMYQRVLKIKKIKEYDFSTRENITLMFNLARLYDDMEKYEQSSKIYEGILEKDPKYIDCYLRLGTISQIQGEFEKASGYYKEAIGVDPKNANAWLLLGKLHIDRGELGIGRKKFEYVLMKTGPSNSNDPYALVSLGKLAYDKVHINESRIRSSSYAELSRAKSFFSKVLKSDPKNVYAANGIGCVLADLNHISEAKDIFVEAFESHDDIPEFLVNVAICNLSLGNYTSSVKMFENVLNNFKNIPDRANIMNILARTYFEMESFEESVKILEDILTIYSNDESKKKEYISIKWNLAFCLWFWGKAAISNPRSGLQQIHDAGSNFARSKTLFEELLETPEEGKDQNDDHHEEEEATKSKEWGFISHTRARTIINEITAKNSYDAKIREEEVNQKMEALKKKNELLVEESRKRESQLEIERRNKLLEEERQRKLFEERSQELLARQANQIEKEKLFVPTTRKVRKRDYEPAGDDVAMYDGDEEALDLKLKAMEEPEEEDKDFVPGQDDDDNEIEQGQMSSSESEAEMSEEESPSENENENENETKDKTKKSKKKKKSKSKKKHSGKEKKPGENSGKKLRALKRSMTEENNEEAKTLKVKIHKRRKVIEDMDSE